MCLFIEVALYFCQSLYLYILFTGSMWQSSLYESLDGSECIVALVSPAYFSSVICQEEYNIALARHLAWVSIDSGFNALARNVNS